MGVEGAGLKGVRRAGAEGQFIDDMPSGSTFSDGSGSGNDSGGGEGGDGEAEGSSGVECSVEGVDVDLDERRWGDMMREVRNKYNETLAVKSAFKTAVQKCVALSSADRGGYCRRCKSLCLLEFSCNEGHLSMCVACFVKESDEGIVKCGRCAAAAPESCGVRYYASAQRELAAHEHKCCLCGANFRHGDLFSHLLTCVCLGEGRVADVVRKMRTLLETIAQICRNHYGMPPTPSPALSRDARIESVSSRLVTIVENEEALTQFLDLIGPPRRALEAMFGRHC